LDDLFNRNRDLDQDIKRNIVSLRKSDNLFDDLSEGDEELNLLAIELEREVKKDIPAILIDRGFHYTTAIEYPFSHEPYLHSRFGDGSYPVWYGAMALETTIFETAYHMMRAELAIEGLDETVYRERAVYNVHCHALLLDLAGKQGDYPALVVDDYAFTQQIGKRLHGEGHPGLIAPSARCDGENVAIFRRETLSQPRLGCYLNYAFDPHTRQVTIERRRGRTLMKLDF